MSDGGVGRVVRLTLHRRVTVLMLFVVTALVGVISLFGLRLEFLPAGLVSTQISIRIPVPNANPVEVEEQVTKPTEEVLRQISGLEEITTQSRKDQARIGIEFARGREPNEAFAEVRDLMEVAKLRWPEDVQEYTASRFNLDTDIPVYSFGLLLDEWNSDTAFIIDEKIIKEIEGVDGVAQVEPWGIVEETIRIWVDKERARSAGVSLFDLGQTLGADNRDVIGGRVTDGGQHYYLRSQGRFRDLDELREFPIRPNLKLKDVAEVTPAMALRNFVFRMNGKRAIWFQVSKEATANTVDVTRLVRERLEERVKPDRRIKAEGWRFYQNDLNDFGKVIENSLSTLVRAALIGGLLAILPLFCFLRRIRLTLIIGLAIPASLLLGLAMLYFGGGTLNILTMLGFTIAIGMLVDNAIVVVENIVRHRDEGKTAFAAALAGTSEVALAITLATLTTVIVFVPLLFLDTGQEISWFMSAVSLPVCYTVIASLFVALVFVPLGTVILFPDGETGIIARLRRLAHVGLAPLYGVAALVNRLILAGTRLHRHVLGWALDYRFAALLVILALGGGVTALTKDRVKVADFGDESGGRVRVNVTLDSNFTLTDANRVFADLYGAIESVGDEIKLDYCFYFFRRTGGGLNIGLNDTGPDETKAAVARVKDVLPELPGVKWRVGVESQNADRTAVPLRIYGPDYQVLAKISEDLTERLEADPLVSEVTGGSGQSEDEIVVEPNRERMQMFGIDPRVLMGTVQYALRGQRLPDFQSGDQKQVLIIEYDDAAATSLTDVEGLRIWSRTGATYPLSQVADIRYEKGYGTIRKTNGESSIALSINAVDASKPELARAAAAVLENYRLPDGYRWSESSSEDLRKQLIQIGTTLLLALILVMLLMGVLFESVLLPLAVFFTIPFAFMGAAWTLALTNTQLDIVGMIGGIVLVGIVVNNGIVFLDCAHGLRTRFASRREALIEAGRLRLRPIAMTTVTTVVGLFPMALTESSGSFVSYKALARGVMGGLLLSTLATLVVVPIAYTLLEDFRRICRDVFRGQSATAESPVEPARLGVPEGP